MKILFDLNGNIVYLVFREAKVENHRQPSKGFFPQARDVVLKKKRCCSACVWLYE